MGQHQELTERYRLLNESFSQKLVWRIGQQAGFFAEYSALLCAMIYCLDHRLQLQIYSADANFGTRKGWTDYFHPFCKEVSDAFHQKYNVGAAPAWCHLWKVAWQERRPQLLLWKLHQLITGRKGRRMAHRCYGEKVLLSDSVKPDYSKTYAFPELDINGGFIDAFRAMAAITWHLNEETQQDIDRLTAELHLQGKAYVGCQVRGGDKVTESALIGPEEIARWVTTLNEGQPVVVLTDDYRLFQDLQQRAPATQWLTLCTPDQRGYVNSSFTQTSAEEKREKMVRFMATMQLLMDCRLFVGSITTGPSVFLMKMKHPDIVAVDCPRHLLPDILFTDIARRAAVSETFQR